MSFTPYMSKMANSLDTLGIKVEYVTWARKDLTGTDNGIDDPHCVELNLLMETQQSSNKVVLLFQYILWMLKLLTFFSFNGKNSKIICSRFETAFPIWILSKFVSLEFMYCDRDNLHSIYPWPNFIRKIIKYIETKVARDSKVHLIPGVSRDFTGFDNVRVIPNLPDRDTLEKSLQFSKENNLYALRSGYKNVVYINGWLKPTRGLVHIKDALFSNRCEDTLFLIAGGIDTNLLRRIEGRTNCIYLGQLSNVVALSYYYIADLVVALYDPRIEINKVAEPNKWWDCAVTNTMFVSNFGIDTLKEFGKYANFGCIDYGAESALTEFLINDFDSLGLKARDIKSIEPWDIQFNKVIQEFLK
ncbi:glycosyltransferase [Vibrio sp. 10N.222.55.F9]|uniref:glycosyltransferase n=1 Tax=Vibrio sp. 10N.222.55.F9 TaxID=1884471 RepID=UPI001056BBC3|nr:glycosyltransferase [Vibrio sp. 10N.222.55.F9]